MGFVTGTNVIGGAGGTGINNIGGACNQQTYAITISCGQSTSCNRGGGGCRVTTMYTHHVPKLVDYRNVQIPPVGAIAVNIEVILDKPRIVNEISIKSFSSVESEITMIHISNGIDGEDNINFNIIKNFPVKIIDKKTWIIPPTTVKKMVITMRQPNAKKLTYSIPWEKKEMESIWDTVLTKYAREYSKRDWISESTEVAKGMTMIGNVATAIGNLSLPNSETITEGYLQAKVNQVAFAEVEFNSLVIKEGMASAPPPPPTENDRPTWYHGCYQLEAEIALNTFITMNGVNK